MISQSLDTYWHLGPFSLKSEETDWVGVLSSEPGAEARVHTYFPSPKRQVIWGLEWPFLGGGRE